MTWPCMMYELDVFLAGGQCGDVVHEAGPDSHTNPTPNPLLVSRGQMEVKLVCLDGGRVAEVEEQMILRANVSM